MSESVTVIPAALFGLILAAALPLHAAREQVKIASGTIEGTVEAASARSRASPTPRRPSATCAGVRRSPSTPWTGVKSDDRVRPRLRAAAVPG